MADCKQDEEWFFFFQFEIYNGVKGSELDEYEWEGGSQGTQGS